MQNILIAILASYSVAILVCEYEGLFGVFKKLRRTRLKPLLKCAVCFGVFTSIAFSIALDLSLVQYFAVVGGVTLLARNT